MNPNPLSPTATPISGAPVEVHSSLEDLPTLPPSGWMATASCQYTDPEVFFPSPASRCSRPAGSATAARW